jgi:hypothetical protein
LRHCIFFSSLIISAFGVLSSSCVKESNFNLKVDTLKIARIYQPDGINGKDAIIESIFPNRNYGDSILFTAFSWSNGGFWNTARALIEFDLSDIPQQTKISTAKLSLYWIRYNNEFSGHTGENAFTIYRINQSWSENSVTWNNQPSISNLDEIEVSKSISASQSYTDIDVTNFVQDIIDNPSKNHGFMLKLDEESPYHLVILASSDFPGNNKHPKLVVYF